MLNARLTEPADPESAATHSPTPGLAAGTPKPAGRTPPKGPDAREHFERLRLAAFAHRGFDGEGRRIADRAGRETYALVSGPRSTWSATRWADSSRSHSPPLTPNGSGG
jgi:hypothetical protein